MKLSERWSQVVSIILGQYLSEDELREYVYGRQTEWILGLTQSVERAIRHNTWLGVSCRKCYNSIQRPTIVSKRMP